MFQTQINIKQAPGLPGEFVDNSPRRVQTFRLYGGAAAKASGTITFAAAASNNDTATVNGVVFTFKTSPSASDKKEVALGSTATESAANLTAAINAVSTYVTAASSAGVVTCTAKEYGADGNNITLAASAATAGTMSGGKDAKPATIGHVFTQTEQGKAVQGGTGNYVGILVSPKEHALIGDITKPGLTVADGTAGSLCRFGVIYVKTTNAASIGAPACYSNADGSIASYSGSAPSGYTAIPNSEFKFVSGAADGLAILQLGD